MSNEKKTVQWIRENVTLKKDGVYHKLDSPWRVSTGEEKHPSEWHIRSVDPLIKKGWTWVSGSSTYTHAPKDEPPQSKGYAIDVTRFTERVARLIAACDEWDSPDAARRVRKHLERAAKYLAQEPLPEWTKAGLALEKAAKIERKEWRRLSDERFKKLYSGNSSTLYSDLINDQKRKPNHDYIRNLMSDVATVDAVTQMLLRDAKPSGSG
jgi:hypothetical protein